LIEDLILYFFALQSLVVQIEDDRMNANESRYQSSGPRFVLKRSPHCPRIFPASAGGDSDKGIPAARSRGLQAPARPPPAGIFMQVVLRLRGVAPREISNRCGVVNRVSAALRRSCSASRSRGTGSRSCNSIIATDPATRLASSASMTANVLCRFQFVAGCSA
jgi:hypothetical protein